MIVDVVVIVACLAPKVHISMILTLIAPLLAVQMDVSALHQANQAAAVLHFLCSRQQNMLQHYLVVLSLFGL